MRHPLSGKRHLRWTADVAAVIASGVGHLRSVVSRVGVSRDERGTVMVEYALVLTLLALGFMAGMRLIENATSAALSLEQTELMNYALRNGT